MLSEAVARAIQELDVARVAMRQAALALSLATAQLETALERQARPPEPADPPMPLPIAS